MVNFTVAIPTYNSEQRLPEVLQCLRLQVVPAELVWEVIVVDNNSRDRTAQVIADYQASDFPCPLWYVLEPRQGAAFARQLAIQEAQSDLIGFLDDDNLPDKHWVAAAYQFAQSHPQAGAFGSQIHGEFEVAPPPNFKRIQSFLAIVERGNQAYCYEPSKRMLPPSAGLAVRKNAWLQAVPGTTALVGRVQGSMLAGEDTEVLNYIQRSGWEIWYNPEMQVRHKIPAWRLEQAYLAACLRGIGLSRSVIRMSRLKPWQKPFMLFAYLGKDLHKLISHFLKYRAQLKTDIVAACEMELYLSILMSPIYLRGNSGANKPR
ncbi:hormogonium polysaccharide biosynthesis glycosyltransferase HpsE [Leptolyngbya sp. FACHB-711]|uniref:hormogonium polysaccharide biosynthesis glycosyltransferase HpsE n=1 Tax=unclassified Leptolyngbya TaxID=2650499 RepID=UPI00168A0010|nr:hormogonium polysaccharide biosynthesis glycosyltransferase HpsE [Leptolyngbya sp. FACHB-711]MBD1853048.1 glycosyltransferase [Cyanobacteria bacterium FACHB-502]MBD2026108.1 glycosyltransferase [Leptolyngbya sp. FACHB-711]